MNETESVESKKLLRVGIYERLSDEDKDKTNKEDDSESIKNQRHLLCRIDKRFASASLGSSLRVPPKEALINS